MKKSNNLNVYKSFIIFADAKVGEDLLKWLIKNHKKDILAVFTTSQNNIFEYLKSENIKSFIFKDEESFFNDLSLLNQKPNLGFLLWWPKIISHKIISSTELGFINTHPSLLPYGRGKNPNFWSIVDETPFGVTLHLVHKGIDTGPIIAQKKIKYTWEDTGETLYKKALESIIELFKNEYSSIRKFEYDAKKQNPNINNFHLAKELDPACILELDELSTPRKILNLIRARTFKSMPACKFIENGKEYEVRVNIKRI